MTNRLFLIALASSLFISQLVCAAPREEPDQKESFKIGWIGPLSGPNVKYGAGQAARLAADDINAEGGVLGRKLELIQEDGQGKGAAAVSALQKLTSVDHVKFILGGQCSPESVAIAPLAQRSGALLLASTTSSPVLSGANPNFYRITPVSTVAGELDGSYAYSTLGLRNAAVVHELTDYVNPVATKFKEVFEARGGKVLGVFSFATGETDFRSVATKIRSLGADVVYIGTQSKDNARLVVKQLRELGVKAQLFGNEQVGNGAIDDPAYGPLFEGLLYAEPEFNINAPRTRAFIEKFKAAYIVTSLPTGVWTAEAYDSVRILAKAVNDCGDDIEAVKRCLDRTKDYDGVCGPVTINALHDGDRKYILKRVGADGQPKPVE